MTKTSFGKSLRSELLLEQQYVPLNHGSFGVVPRPIRALQREFLDKEEQHPDRWHRFEVLDALRKNREYVAKLINCRDPADIVFQRNATTAINTILRTFPFEKGDKVLCFSVAYESVPRCLKYLQDAGRIQVVQIELNYPLNDSEILDLIRTTIEREEQGQEGRIRLAIIDAIVATPGVRFPFEAAVKLVQGYGILAMVDGAHSLGQIQLDMEELDADFFLSNLHKWFFTPRGACLLYVPKRNQKYIQPLVISYDYKRPDEPGYSFEDAFAYPGVEDLSPYLCISAVIDYRKSLGGEDTIMKYCHELAVQGGELVAKILGTRVLENEDKTLTACMVNVELPLKESKLSVKETTQTIVKKLIHEHNTMASPFYHNGKYWVRLSAQIYNDISDFEYGAHALQKICTELEK